MKYVKGNLVAAAKDGLFDVIIHGCNCQCTMNSGVAREIRQNFPSAYEVDCKTKKGDSSKLGSYTYTTVESDIKTQFTIFNAYTQDRYGVDTGPHFNIVAFERSMVLIRDSIFSDARIGIPKIGAGLGGGNWDDISKKLEEIFEGYDLTVVVLE